MDDNQVSYLSQADLDDLLAEDPMGLNAMADELLGHDNEAAEADLGLNLGEELPALFDEEPDQQPAAAPVVAAPEPVPDLGPAREGLMALLARLDALVLSVPAEAPERAGMVDGARAVLEHIQEQFRGEIENLERRGANLAHDANDEIPADEDGPAPPPLQEDVETASSDDESIKSTIYCAFTTLVNSDDNDA
ncbi:hypothetical protein PG985_003496 [Apiospora marii]|uniref:uncharacterized protein n=1 Tax=Apiospora marii TaxID=335849 RepID=UPI00313092A2